jgi:myo-inositol 2-dehydrogenase / D-chiro-inositol 1-dehydrogenase
MTARLRVGMLSGVRHAGQYARLLAADPRVELVGIAESANAADWMIADSKAVAASLGLPFVPGIEQFLDTEALDMAIVCSEPTRHAALAIAALDRSIDTLVDKPIAATLDGAVAVSRAAEASSSRCSVVNRTYSHGLRRLRRWVDDGSLGLPLHVDVEYLSSGAHFAEAVERPEMVIDPALSGGGEALNFLGYAIDAVHMLTGLAVVDVYAEMSCLFDFGHARHDVEDCSVVSLLLEHGVTATLTVGRTPAAAGYGPGSSSVRLIGSHGHATADDDEPQVMQFGSDRLVSAHPVGGGGGAALAGFFDDVVASMIDGSEPRYTVRDALATMSVIDAAYRSSRDGTNVGIERA